MNAVDFFVNFFITLFALLDPIGNVPIFAAATRNTTLSHRRWLIVYITIFSALFLSFFFFTGLKALQFFGISMDSFRIAGGILLFMLGLDMTRGDFLSMFENVEVVKDKDALASAKKLSSRDSAKISFEKLVVPFAIPLLIGPGAISTVIIQAGVASKIDGPQGFIAGILAIIAASLAILVTFLLSETIAKLLGRVGMVVVIRVLGLVLCALAIQMITSSVSEITHNLILPSAAHPYTTSHR